MLQRLLPRLGDALDCSGVGAVGTRADSAEQEGETADSAFSFEVSITPEVTFDEN